MLMQLRCAAVAPLLGALPFSVAHRKVHGTELDEALDLKDYERADLCNNKVVEDGCSRLRELQDGQADETTLQKAVELSLSAKTLSSFWEALNIHDDSVDCQRLCLEAVKYIGANGVLPAKNDYACYNVGKETVCDAYVGDDILHTFGPPEDKDIPDLHDDEVKKKLAKEQNDAASNGSSTSFLQRAVSLADLHADNVMYSNWEAAERIANFFHIYPVQHPEEDADPQAVEKGAHDGQGDKPEASMLLEQGREGPRNMGRWPFGGKRTTQRKLAEAKVYVNAAIEHFERRATFRQMDRWFGSETYDNEDLRKEILKIMNSVRHMLGNIEVFPIGKQCTHDTYAYVYPEAYQCYNYDEMYDNACTMLNDKFVFYVCDLYFERPSEMIETLVHEGSHHATAYTEDVDFHGQKAYGRSACKEMARVGAGRLARRNADSFCYYIQDIADQLGTNSYDSRRRSQVPSTRRRSYDGRRRSY